jgi:outer membrane protein
VETGTKGLFLAVAADVKRYDSARHFLQSAMRLEKMAKKAWQNGSGTIVEWFESQKNLLQARQALLQVRYDYIEHRTSLYRMTGELSIKEIEKVNEWLALPSSE